MAYKKGESGNLAGRPAGQTAGAKIRKAIEARKDDILKAVINAAVNGDMTACKMLLDRITPTLKPVAAQVAITVSDGASLYEQAAAVTKSALNGEIGADLASQLLAGLSNMAKIREFDELEARLQALERKNGQP